MRSISRLRTPLHLASALLALAFAVPTYAATTNDLQHIAITPSSAELAINPGAAVVGTLSVINQGNDSFNFSTTVAPYHVQGINYDPQFTPLPGTVDASKWVQLKSSASQLLTPGQLVHVDFTVVVPPGTAPGGYYAVVFAETSPLSNEGGVVPHNRVGEILYITVNGTVRTTSNVLPGALGSINTSGSLPVSLLVQNTGGVHFKSTTTVTIKNIFGKQVFKQSADRYILPQTEREVTIPWTNHVPIGIYHISREATVPEGTKTLSNKTVLMIQPWLIVVIIIALLLLLVTWLRNKREKRKQA